VSAARDQNQPIAWRSDSRIEMQGTAPDVVCSFMSADCVTGRLVRRRVVSVSLELKRANPRKQR
jgi:hypothetical protein